MHWREKKPKLVREGRKEPLFYILDTPSGVLYKKKKGGADDVRRELDDEKTSGRTGLCRVDRSQRVHSPLPTAIEGGTARHLTPI